MVGLPFDDKMVEAGKPQFGGEEAAQVAAADQTGQRRLRPDVASPAGRSQCPSHQSGAHCQYVLWSQRITAWWGVIVQEIYVNSPSSQIHAAHPFWNGPLGDLATREVYVRCPLLLHLASLCHIQQACGDCCLFPHYNAVNRRWVLGLPADVLSHATNITLDVLRMKVSEVASLQGALASSLLFLPPLIRN